MTDHKEIYLQPECCADSETGRLWCVDDAPEKCEDGKPWTRYIRADLSDERIENLIKALKMVQSKMIAGDDNPDEAWVDFTADESEQIHLTLANHP